MSYRPLIPAKMQSVLNAIPIESSTNILAVVEQKKEITNALKAHQVIIVAGETGCGKSTHLPLLCLEAGRGIKKRIACTQPRRIAAVSLAHYVAALCSTKIGELIGYKVRFHQQLFPSARISYMTDGILISEISSDPLLNQYDTIIIDEAHERSIAIDFLLGYLRTILPKRPELKIIISSATLDTALFSRSFSAPVIKVTGRTFPIEIRYKPMIEMWDGTAMRSCIDSVISTVKEIIDSGQDGNILVFLPSITDVQETTLALTALTSSKNCRVLPLHSRLSLKQQQEIFKSGNLRTIVVATNIAETSITVPNIHIVIDTGLARIVRYDPLSGITRLPIERISAASADQRAGRCGRVRNGICIRLYSEQDYLSRPRFTTAEIKRCNLAEVVLRMLYLGIKKPQRFPFLSAPSAEAFNDAYKRLRNLGALLPNGNLSPLGQAMARLPLDPSLSRMLIEANRRKVIKEVSVIAAALSVADPRTELTNKLGGCITKSRKADSDFIILLNIWNEASPYFKNSKMLQHFCQHYRLAYNRMREWRDVYLQILRICKKLRGNIYKTHGNTIDNIHKCILSGLAENIALRQQNGLYRTVSGHDIMVHPGSVLFDRRDKWIVFHEIFETSRLFGLPGAVVKPEWIEEMFGPACEYRYENLYYDPQRGVVMANERVLFNGLELFSNRQINYSALFNEKAHRVFIEEALLKGGLGDNYAFLKHNRNILEQIRMAEHKLRSHSLYIGDRAFILWYSERLGTISTRKQLNQTIRAHGNDKFLHIKFEELSGGQSKPDSQLFPDKIEVATFDIAVSYLFEPDSDDDGICLNVPLNLFREMPLYYWEWCLPQLNIKRVEYTIELLKNVVAAKDLKAEKLTAELANMEPQPLSFVTALSKILSEKFGVENSRLTPQQIPAHLWPKLRIIGPNATIVKHFRLHYELFEQPDTTNQLCGELLAPLCTEWEKKNVFRWDFGELPRKVFLCSKNQQVPIPAFAALHAEGTSVAIRTFYSLWAAQHAHIQGVKLLLELNLGEELAWMLRELCLPKSLVSRCGNFFSNEQVEQIYFLLIHHAVLEIGPQPPCDAHSFLALKEKALTRIPNCALQCETIICRFIDEYEKCKGILSRRLKNNTGQIYEKLGDHFCLELERYRKFIFEAIYPIKIVERVPRWIESLCERINYAFLYPHKYLQRIEPVSKIGSLIDAIQKKPQSQLWECSQIIEQLRFDIEEYKMQLAVASSSIYNGKISLHLLQEMIKKAENLLLAHQ